MARKKTDTGTGKTRYAVYISAALLAAAAGFGAVYVNFSPLGNVAPNVTNDAPAPDASGLTAQARGEMANFVVHDEPRTLPAVSFMNGEGAEKTLADWRGKVVLLNLWATWCGPCREEMPSLDTLKERMAEEEAFDLVAVSVDKGGPDKPRAFLEEIGVKNLKLYNDPEAKLNVRLKAFGMPTTLLIDRQGREIGRLTGPAEWDTDEAVALIRAAIDRTAPS